MALVLNGTNNTIGGLAVGGLPDGCVDNDMLATSLYKITTYTPTWGGVTNTSTHAVFEYFRIGKMITVRGQFKCASTTNNSTVITFSLPVTPASNPTNGIIDGSGSVSKSNVDTVDYGSLHPTAMAGEDNAKILAQSDNVAWTYLTSTRVAVNDEMVIFLVYHGV